jgi:hypothetical protein
MKTHANSLIPPVPDSEWTPFPGGELEGTRPRVLCVACREQLQRQAQASSSAGLRRPSLEGGAHTHRIGRPGAPLCFACYRATLLRDRALQAAGGIDTASESRFQSLLPLEPVNHSRLARLRAERAVARDTARSAVGCGAVVGACVDRRRQAQISARHALQQIGAGLRRQAAAAAPQDRQNRLNTVSPDDGATAASHAVGGEEMWAAIHAAELQLPETWLPFVTAR